MDGSQIHMTYRNPKSHCLANVPYVQATSNISILSPYHLNLLHKELLSHYR